jgi:hypothetical protein
MGTTGELPLASYITNSIWDGEQRYRLLPEAKEMRLEFRSIVAPESVEPDYRPKVPLPQRSMMLRWARPEEEPDRVGALSASDTFVGGESFVRVTGSPIWLQDPLKPRCSCGAAMVYAASIGYEVEAGVWDEPFFIGEGALYFFVCGGCRQVTVLSQST